MTPEELSHEASLWIDWYLVKQLSRGPDGYPSLAHWNVVVAELRARTMGMPIDPPVFSIEDILDAAAAQMQQGMAHPEVVSQWRVRGLDAKRAAIVLKTLARVRRRLAEGKYREVENLSRRAITIMERTVGDVALAGVYHLALGDALTAQGRHADAERAYRRALTINVAELPSGDLTVSLTQRRLADVLSRLGRQDEAERFYDWALRRSRQAIEDAETLVGVGRANQALPLLEHAVHVQEVVLGPYHPAVGATLLQTVSALRAAADQTYRRAVAIGETRSGGDPPDTTAEFSGPPSTLRAPAGYAEAQQLYRSTLMSVEGTAERRPAELARSLHNAANFVVARGQLIEAERLYRQALEVLGWATRIEPTGLAETLQNLRQTARTLNSLAEVLLMDKRFIEAETLLRRAGATLEAILPRTHPEVTASARNLEHALQGGQENGARTTSPQGFNPEIRERSDAEIPWTPDAQSACTVPNPPKARGDHEGAHGENLPLVAAGFMVALVLYVIGRIVWLVLRGAG